MILARRRQAEEAASKAREAPKTDAPPPATETPKAQEKAAAPAKRHR